MKRTFLGLFLGLGAAIATGAAAQAGNCADRSIVIARLADGFGESRQSIGMGSHNSVIEVFASLETGTWTITVTTPDGSTCLVASGRAFERLDEAPVPEGVRL